MWDVSSPTTDRTRVPCTGRRILNHWTTREAPRPVLRTHLPRAMHNFPHGFWAKISPGDYLPVKCYLFPWSSLYFFVFINLLILFIYFWLCWVLVAVHRLSLVAVSRGYSSLRCAGFLLQWPLLLQSTGSRHTGFGSCDSRALECRLSSCGARA